MKIPAWLRAALDWESPLPNRSEDRYVWFSPRCSWDPPWPLPERTALMSDHDNNNMPENFRKEIDFDLWETPDDEFTSEGYDPTDLTGRWVTLRSRAVVASLRDFADWLEKHPATAAAIAPWGHDGYGWSRVELWANAYNYTGGEHTFAPEQLEADRRLHDLNTKFIQDSLAGYFKDFGVIRLKLQFSREAVCRMVETGEVEKVEVEKVVTPAVTETVIEERPVVQRVCAKVWTKVTDDA